MWHLFSYTIIPKKSKVRQTWELPWQLWVLIRTTSWNPWKLKQQWTWICLSSRLLFKKKDLAAKFFAVEYPSQNAMMGLRCIHVFNNFFFYHYLCDFGKSSQDYFTDFGQSQTDAKEKPEFPEKNTWHPPTNDDYVLQF